MRIARHAANYRIREIRAADNAALVELIRETRSEHRIIIGAEAPALEKAERNMHGLYGGPRSYFLVIDNGQGHAVGGGGIAPLAGGDRRTCELQRMYFRPEIRGLGLGFRVLADCVDKARELRYSAMYAETMAGMERANRLYEKAGFRRLSAPVGETGHTFTDAWFWKDL